LSLPLVTKLTDYRWLNLFDVEYVGKNGNTGHWTFASRKQNPQPSTAPMQADAVVILAIHRQGQQRRLVAIKEFRIPLGDYEWGLPAGLYDHNETAQAVCRRELKEETGLDVTDVLYVGPPAVSSAGLSDESVVYVVYEYEGTPNTDGTEGAEDIQVQLLDLEGVRSLIRSGEKVSAKALPFLYMFEALGKIDWPASLINTDQ
jgi:ADP-ribose pyrophosphatase